MVVPWVGLGLKQIKVTVGWAETLCTWAELLRTWAAGLNFGFFLEFEYRGSKPDLSVIISGIVAYYPKLCSGFSGSGFSGSGSGFSGSVFGFRVICPAIGLE